MDFSGKNSGTVTPMKGPKPNRSKISEVAKKSENLNPNYTSPEPKLSNSAPSKSTKKPHKSAPKNPNPVASPSPRKKIRERKFVVAKKNSKREKSNSSRVACKCNISGKSQKCLCIAYETLRASQEGFFRNRGSIVDYSDRAENGVKGEEEVNPIIQNPDIPDGYEEKLGENDCLEKNGLDETDEVTSEMGSTTMKRRRDKLLEKAMQSVPEPGSGRVLHLVKAFENLLSIPKSRESDEKESKDTKKGMKWALPGLQSEDPETQSFESSGTFGGRQWKRHHKVTSQKPFNLRTEQRGRSKEEEFIKKVQEKMMEEEKERIPIAQGLPWTTDEPERLAKPSVKESTRPVDLVLHSDVRAVERAEFDHQVVEKMSFIEQYRTERERQQKLAEEEEIRRLRMELVLKAQPMPYFDRPFIPRRVSDDSNSGFCQLRQLQIKNSAGHVVKGSEVFVGGLARTVTEDKITEVFSTCGEILEIRLIKDQNGSSKGFCFVRFSTKAAADKAVKEKSGLLLDGKKIGVLPSVEQDSLFLGNLNKGWRAEELNMLVRQVFPDVVSVDLAMPSSSGESPPGQKKQNHGFAFVKFSSHAVSSSSSGESL